MTTSRIIGEYKGKEGGPKLVFTAGMHGNETGNVLMYQAHFMI